MAAPKKEAEARFPQPGDVFAGRHEIRKLICDGRITRVYEARNTTLARLEALEILPERLCGPDAAARLERATRIAASPQHQNIVAVYETGTHGGLLYIATELVVGPNGTVMSVADLLRRGPCSEEDVVRIAIGLCAALQELRSAERTVHLDLHPRNIFLDTNLIPKLVDFGPSSTSWIAADCARGQLAPGETPGPASDVFSLGATILEMLTGLLPAGPWGTFDPPRMDRHSPGWEQIIRCCLEEDPTRRFGSAAELREKLEALGVPGETQASPGAKAPPSPGGSAKATKRKALPSGTATRTQATTRASADVREETRPDPAGRDAPAVSSGEEETLGWGESCEAARRVFERMEDRSREASKREAALIEELDLEDLEL